MNSNDISKVERFLERWLNSQGNERANYQMFFAEFCDVLGVTQPDVKGSITGDRYCFDKDVKIVHPSGKYTSGFIDFYKEAHFVIEAKQGSSQAGKGTAKRGTNSYRKAMKEAYYQAVAYAKSLPIKPPFILTCDIGSHFEVWQGFSESWVGATGDYGDYDAKRKIELSELTKPEIFDFFVTLFTDPQQLNPEKIAAQVTKKVAEDLAELAKTLESPPTPLNKGGVRGDRTPEAVAHFLMRCIFTMFAEDVGFLKEHLFTEALEKRWIPNPKSFKPEAEVLWKAMNIGGSFGFHGQLLRFNGNLFADASAFELTGKQLQILLQAAKRDWRNVEPAIFGTLLERALDSKERSKLGAHYTPRSYVERLVRPVVIEPLQEQWQLVKGEVEQLLDNGDKEPTKTKRNKAEKILEEFLQYLQNIKILDPACGSGNFLYVTLDLMKSLESEVFQHIVDITGKGEFKLDFAQINPSQFLGIEINPRAAAIADLVIWIGYLQWHYRCFGNVNPIEPVLQAYNNIECRDAVLEYDDKESAIDKDTGKVRTRWGGKMMTHPVTGEDVPDPSDQITIYNYINPRPGVWQKADYIVSNPPFIGNARMRERLGDGYTEALRKVYPDVPDTVDFVMYWWHKSAQLSSRGVMLFGSGFIVEEADFDKVESEKLFLYLNGKDLLHKSRNVQVIDLFNHSIKEVQDDYPKSYQWLLDKVKPERDSNRDKGLREKWWIFGRPRSEIRPALKNISRYIATVETSKHRIFTFLDKNILPDNMLIIIAVEDSYFLGVLSSYIHVIWALKAGGDLGGNTPRYNKTRCFDPFPFPTPTETQKQTIRELGERLDNHRKQVQEKHPDITITGMYNLLEKIRNNEPLTDKEKEYNNRALVSTLKQIHDELDVAVFAAYGWDKNLSDEEILENLVKLNAERAEEERNGLIRWLRPEYQAPEETIKQTVIKDIKIPETEIITPVEQQQWAKTFKEQLAAIRDLLRTGGEWTEAQIAAQFKGKKKTDAVANCLEILQSLGLIISHTENNTTRYYAAELQQIGD